MKILWASPNTLLDTSNGAAITIREYLHQLSARGWEIRILGGTVFVNQHGMSGLREFWNSAFKQKGDFVNYQDGSLIHRLMVTQQARRVLLYSYELEKWFEEYRKMLHEEKPDIVLFFDKSLITSMTANEAKALGIKVGVILNHGNNHGSEWCRDLDFMLTDTKATAEMYRVREGYSMTPVGKFIDTNRLVADSPTRKRLLFVNPIPAKGGVLVVQLAYWLSKHRPDIELQIVDSRGTWGELLKRVTLSMSEDSSHLKNVIATPNTPDMKAIYAQARVLLVPSLWWESGGRVAVEAMANGIPVVASNVGGLPEVLGTSGQVVDIPSDFRKPPYIDLLPPEVLEKFSKAVCDYWDDDELYAASSEAAKSEFLRLHSIERNGDELSKILTAVVIGE